MGRDRSNQKNYCKYQNQKSEMKTPRKSYLNVHVSVPMEASNGIDIFTAEQSVDSGHHA
jgi:hypothetical protein